MLFIWTVNAPAQSEQIVVNCSDWAGAFFVCDLVFQGQQVFSLECHVSMARYKQSQIKEQNVQNRKQGAENGWINLAALVPWEVAEERYAARFVNNGHPAHPARMALGALLIRRRLQCSDQYLVTHVGENPYLQLYPKLFVFPILRRRAYIHLLLLVTGMRPVMVPFRAKKTLS